jgi:transcriptional regulator with XRE-family HTH domain
LAVVAADYRVILGSAIREQRRRAGLSQEVLAEKSNLHPNYLGRVERGEEYISIAALRNVAKALCVRVSKLVEDI